jgi:hypothetical protein
MAQSVVQRTEVRIEALRDTIAEMLSFDEPRKLVAGLISGLDVVYDLAKTKAALDLVGKAHALLETLSESAEPPRRSKR